MRTTLARRGEAVLLRYGPNREEGRSRLRALQRALAPRPAQRPCIEHLGGKICDAGDRLAERRTSETDIRRASELTSRALASNPNSYHAQHAKARLLLAQKHPEQSLVTAELSLALNPSFIPTYQILCMANLVLRPTGRGQFAYADKAMRLSPLDPYVYIFYALKAYGHAMLGDHDRAIGYLRQSVANNPEFPTPIAWLAAMLAVVGQETDAREMLKHYLTRSGTKTRTIAQLRSLQWADTPDYVAYRERLYEGLRRAGMPEE